MRKRIVQHQFHTDGDLMQWDGLSVGSFCMWCLVATCSVFSLSLSQVHRRGGSLAPCQQHPAWPSWYELVSALFLCVRMLCVAVGRGSPSDLCAIEPTIVFIKYWCVLRSHHQYRQCMIPDDSDCWCLVCVSFPPGYIFSEDYRQIWRASEALECGIIGVNMGVPTSVETPFGGFKQSGIGSEGSKYGINEYINTKFIGMGDLKF